MPELPPPLPPAERTVGQLVAETIRAYGANFWRVLPLGIPIAVSSQISLGYDANVQTVVLFAFGPLIALAYVYACHLVHQVRITPVAYLTAVLVFAPVPLLVRAAVLPAVAWLALFGLAPAAAMIERLGFRASLARGRRLGAADYVHALGSLATLVIVVVVVRADADRAAAVAGRQRTANRARAGRPRAQPAPVPGRRTPLYRPGREGRLPPTTPKEPPRCRSSSSSRR